MSMMNYDMSDKCPNHFYNPTHVYYDWSGHEVRYKVYLVVVCKICGHSTRRSQDRRILDKEEAVKEVIGLSQIFDISYDLVPF